MCSLLSFFDNHQMLPCNCKAGYDLQLQHHRATIESKTALYTDAWSPTASIELRCGDCAACAIVLSGT